MPAKQLQNELSLAMSGVACSNRIVALVISAELSRRGTVLNAAHSGAQTAARTLRAMAEESKTIPALGGHGADTLPAVEVDSYNIELKDADGFVGDRAGKKAFHAIIEKWRKPLRKHGSDPFGEAASSDISKKKLDAALGSDRSRRRRPLAARQRVRW